MAHTEEDLKYLLSRVKTFSEEYEPYLCAKKTKNLTTSGMHAFRFAGEDIEVVENFTFLGANVEKDGAYGVEMTLDTRVGGNGNLEQDM